MESIDKARLCLKTIKERKAVDPVLLHVENLTSVSDYFLITSGNSTRQVQAITRHLQKTLREAGLRPYGTEGEQEGHWVLMDFGDVVVHIFYQPLREFYDLEGLWIEAPEVEADDPALKEIDP
ncbi:MAG: ribosome silencing factor [Deltaproteobacteria bacterium]|nr:ribosome silencing factor [Deltaproteobacteria bacterium]